MLVASRTKNLVLKLSDPERVTTVIPTAKQFEFRGQRFVAVPHRIEETRVLRNLGFKAPSPIRHYYDWPIAPGRIPFDHQYVTSAFLTLNSRAYCLNDMGTGKTLSVLWASDYLYQEDLIDGVLIISPLSTMERAWGDEIFGSFGDRYSFTVLHGTAEKRLQRLAQPHDFYIINHDGIKSSRILNALIEKLQSGRWLVVVDELAAFRNASTGRWKAVNKLTKLATYLWGLTGTPIPNEPTDAWAQCRLITPETVPRHFGTFRDTVMRQSGPFKWVAKPTALDHVHSVMQPAVRFSRDECLDLPPISYQKRNVPLTPEQEKAYKEMLTKMKTEIAGSGVTAINEAAMLSKLVQICVGVVYTKTGEVEVPADTRIAAVLETIEQAPGKVIVFVPFTGALRVVHAAIGEHYRAAMIYGDTPPSERAEIFGQFQKYKDPHVIVAAAGTMSHGLTLTAASTVVWFGPINSADIYWQANARIPRPGQVNNMLVTQLEGSAAERKMYGRLDRRVSTQGVLLELFEEAGV